MNIRFRRLIPGIEWKNAPSSAEGVPAIIDSHNINNAWYAGAPENTEISGEMDILANVGKSPVASTDVQAPSATQRPAVTASDSNFNNQQTLSFDAVDEGLIVAISGFLSGDSTGAITLIIKTGSASVGTYPFFGSNDYNSGSIYMSMYRFHTGSIIRSWTGAFQAVDTTNTFTNTDKRILTLRQNGTNAEFFINGVKEAVSTSNTSWFNSSAGRDNISIGMLAYGSGSYAASTKLYSNGDWAFTGIQSGTLSDSDITDLHTALNNVYGVY